MKSKWVGYFRWFMECLKHGCHILLALSAPFDNRRGYSYRYVNRDDIFAKNGFDAGVFRWDAVAEKNGCPMDDSVMSGWV